MHNYIVKDIMSTNLVTIGPEDSIVQAVNLLKTHKIRQLPVCIQGKIVGIITDRDLRQILGSNFYQYSNKDIESLSPEKSIVASYMTPKPITISPETSVEEAIGIINSKKFGSLPVCNKDGTLIGIVTVTDISGLLLKLLQENN